MNPVPRPMVFSAATILAGVCVLGLYLGIHDSLGRPYSSEGVTPASSGAAAPTPTSGAATAIEAKPMQSDLPASSEPAKVAEAKPKPKASEDDEDQDAVADTIPASDVLPATHQAPEPPPLYPPPGEPANPPPTNDNNAPPY